MFPKFWDMTRKIPTFATAVTFAALLGSGAEAQALRGSPASVNRIHSQALAHNLRFFPSGSSIRNAANGGELRRLEPNANFRVVNVSYPYVVAATHTFVLRLAAQYRAACGEQLVVTSATRPTSMRLANSVDKSVHPTGMAVDLRKPTNSRCLRWLRSTLVALKASGVLEAVEERNPPHFHVAVFPRQYSQYLNGRSGGTQLASAAPSRASASTSAGASSYRVRKGDSLWTIARRNNVTVDRLKEVNSLKSSRILAGQVLKIP